MEIKAIIFDMDGVILDSETICNRTWAIAAKDYNISLEDSLQIQKACLGTNKYDSCIILRKILGDAFPAEKYLEKTSLLFQEIERTEGIPLMPFVKEILEYLKPKYRIALASSTRQIHVQRELSGTGVIQYFETLTTGDMVQHSKPDPEIYLMACKSLGLKPEECVAIEDSPNGIKSAFYAGLKTIMVPDQVKPTEEIKQLCWKICNSLKEIETIL